MMNCNMSAYAGAEPYAYWISSHRDDGISFPMLERLAKRGLRVWHDAQIRSIQSEWKSTTSQKLNASAAVLVLFSQNFAETHICRRQFTDAIESKKPILVIRLGKPILTLGMTLQTEANTTLACDFPPTDALIDNILRQDFLGTCIGSPNQGIAVQAYTHETPDPAPVSRPVRRVLSSEQSIIDLANKASSNKQKPLDITEPDEKLEDDPPSMPQTDLVDNNPPIDRTVPGGASYDQTILSAPFNKEQEADSAELDQTLIPRRMTLPVILSLSTGHVQKGLSGETVVGRQAKLQTELLADIRFSEQSKLFSRRHLKIICVDNTCTLICLHDNGLSLSGITELPPDEPYRLEGPCVIEVPGKIVLEQFSNKEDASARFVIAYEQDAQELWDAPYVATMESMETGEIRAFWSFPIMIGRNYPWVSGAMSTKTISGNHGAIIVENDQFYLEDHSTNGTIINENTLCKNRKHVLNHGDVLRINGERERNLRDENFVFRVVKVERANES